MELGAILAGWSVCSGMSVQKSWVRKRYLVKWVLLFAAIGWGISIWFVLVPWKVALAGLVEMGALPISYDPFLDYWMRVIGLVFVMIGGGCFLVAMKTEFYAVVVPLIGWFHFAVGVCSLVLAVLMKMSGKFYPTLVAEIIFSLVVGLALLVFWEGGGGKMLEGSS